MANTFLDLPMPAGDGAGTAVNTSAMGKEKTIVVGGPFIGATITVEVAVDNATVFQPLTTFSGPGKKVINVACQFMRVFVRGRSSEPFSGNCDVGANDVGGVFGVALNIPAGDGVGTSVDISSLGNFSSIISGGSFRDAVLNVEVSEDNVSFASCVSFQDPGSLHIKELIANWARVRVSGRAGNTFPFTPSISMGATNDAASGGIGATGQTFLNSLSLGEGDSHNSATPLVVGQREFNPLDYALNNAVRTLKFRAVAANGGGVASTNVQLYSLTDSEVITTLNFTSPTATAKEVAILEGAGAGQIDLSNKVYECRIFVDVPDGVDDTIELGSVEIQVINTVS